MTIYDAKNVELFVGGQKLSGLSSASYSRKEIHDEDVEAISTNPLIYSGTCEVEAGPWVDLMALFTTKRNGASDATLQRRVNYGGRKGRRAFKRLLARGVAVWRTVDDHVELTLRGHVTAVTIGGPVTPVTVIDR